MTDIEIIEKAIADGYYIAWAVFSLAEIQQGNKEFLKTGYFGANANAFANVFDLQTGKESSRAVDEFSGNFAKLFIQLATSRY